MKIGVDIHGVLDDNKFFKRMTKLFVANGDEVHIITGKEWKKIKNEMIRYNREMERIRQEAAAKAQREEEERARLERERLEKEALEAIEAGKEEEAEELAAQVNGLDDPHDLRPGQVLDLVQ